MLKYAILIIFSGIKLIKNSSKKKGIKFSLIEINIKLNNTIINKIIFKKLNPKIQIIGVQSQAVPGMRASFLAGKIKEVKILSGNQNTLSGEISENFKKEEYAA